MILNIIITTFYLLKNLFKYEIPVNKHIFYILTVACFFESLNTPFS